MGKVCRHFMAVLGTSLYTDCIYEVEGTDFARQTPYAQLAVLKYLEEQGRSTDKISILLTDRAKEQNWFSRAYTEREKEQLTGRGMQIKPEEKKTGLSELLKEACPHVPVTPVRIPEGRSQEELDGIFETIYGIIKPGETVCFDFTHGLRNIPMQVLTIIHYAKALKHIKVDGMYYGAYELGEKRDGISHVRLLDMTMCSEILNWTSAAESFVESGNSAQIWSLYGTGKQKGGRKTREDAVIKSLHDLTNCISTCRGKTEDSPEKSIRKAYEEFRGHYELMKKHQEEMSAAPLARLFDRIWEELKIFLQKWYVIKDGRKIPLDSTSTGAAVVRWAVEKGQTQLGFTALEEMIVTYVGECCGLPAEDQDVRETIIGGPLGYMIHTYGAYKKRKNENLPEEELEQICRRAGEEKTAEREEELEKMKRNAGLEKVRDIAGEMLEYNERMKHVVREIPMELIRLASSIVQYRNTLNHFGFQKNVMYYKTLQGNLKKLYEQMLRIMESEGAVLEQMME